MNDPVRKSYHHQRVLWAGGVISYHAAKCHEFGLNPDVDELERYNIAAKARECNHEKLRYIANDDGGGHYVCGGCDLSDRNWSKKFNQCRACSWRRDPKCTHCRGTGLIPIQKEERETHGHDRIATG